jgi:ubiquinone/menaquinone biosynthesis C-methylase UbiE
MANISNHSILPDELPGTQQRVRIGLEPTSLLGAHAAFLAASRTGLWRLLCAGPQTPAKSAELLNLNLRGTECVLEVLAACGIAFRQGDCYRLASDDSTAGLALTTELVDKLQMHFDSTVNLLRTGKPLAFMDDSVEQREISYSTSVENMAEGFSPAAAILAQRLALKPRRILDVGCGSGVWSLAFAVRNPEVQVVGLDFPKVLAAFNARAEALGVARQVIQLPGNMFDVELPQEPFDLVIIANVLRLEAPEKARSLVSRFASAVRPGGALVIVDALSAGTLERELQRAVYALHLALRTNIGRVYSPAEVMEWLSDAACVNPVEIDLGTHPGALGAVLAERAS